MREQVLSDFSLQQDTWLWSDPDELYKKYQALKAENEELKQKVAMYEKTT